MINPQVKPIGPGPHRYWKWLLAIDTGHHPNLLPVSDWPPEAERWKLRKRFMEEYRANLADAATRALFPKPRPEHSA